jgi:hypothetical protein
MTNFVLNIYSYLIMKFIFFSVAIFNQNTDDVFKISRRETSPV